MLSVLLGISSEVELLDHGVLRFLSAGDGENVHILLKPGLENFEHYFTSM